MTVLFTDLMAYDLDPETTAEQYGVPGMKWGRRRGSSEPVRVSSDRKAADAARKPHIQTMTNKQLKTANTRIQLEKTYSDLTRQPSALDKIKKGNAIAGTILATVGIGVTVYNMAKSPAGQAAIATGKKVLNTAKNARGIG